MEKRIWGVMGKMGAGKDVVTDYLQELGWQEIGMGDIVREIACERGIEPARENLDKIQNEYTDKYGRGFLSKTVIERIEKSDYINIAVNGIRRPEDAEELEKAYDDIFLLGVDADPKVRFDRMKSRGRIGDPKTYEEFLEMDANQEKIFRIDETFSKADYILHNNGTMEELKKKVDELLVI